MRPVRFFFVVRADYERENVCRLIMVYAIFSTYAYLVNMLLASRFMRISDQLSAFLSYAALVIYVLECGINWYVLPPFIVSGRRVASFWLRACLG
jgi:hypothetical protein